MLETRRLLSAVTWVGQTSGDFDDPNNWSGGAVPGAQDDVTINVPAGVVVMHTAAVTDTVHSLTSNAAFEMQAGTLAVATTLTLTNTFKFDGGTLSGASVVGSANL